MYTAADLLCDTVSDYLRIGREEDVAWRQLGQWLFAKSGFRHNMHVVAKHKQQPINQTVL